MAKKKPALSIDLDREGNVIAIAVDGQPVKFKEGEHNCGKASKTLVYKLSFHKPVAVASGASNPSKTVARKSKGARKGVREASGGASNPCCMVANGTRICWPPCVP